MPIEISEIKNIRKKLGLTQTELANRAQVSQSLIAKIESNRLDPTYSNAKKIFTALAELGKKQELKASEIMTNRIISVTSLDEVKEAIAKMKKFNISQMPVVDNTRCVGLISESTILEAMIKKKGNHVKDFMDDCPPIVSKKTAVTVISDLLKYYPLVLVSEMGHLQGVITKSDLLAQVYK